MPPLVEPPLVEPPLVEPLSDGAVEEPDPGGQSMLLLLAPGLLVIAVLPAVELGLVALPLRPAQLLLLNSSHY